MGILLHHHLGVGDLYIGQQLHGLFPGLLLLHALVDDQRLGELPLHGEHRIQRGHRLLEDDGDGVAADAVKLGPGQLGQLPAVEIDLAGFNVAVFVQKLKNAHGGDTLA